MGQEKFHRTIRVLHRIPKIGIPFFLFALLWIVAGDERLMDAFARFTFDAYLVGFVTVGLAVLVVIVVLSLRRS
jgi:Flp pilus assembly protein protease CpaA